MTIDEAMKTFRLPNPTTAEDLESRERKIVNFSDKVLMAGRHYTGENKPCWYGAVYGFLTEDKTCEGPIGLKAVSEVEWEDDGHAIKWAMIKVITENA